MRMLLSLLIVGHLRVSAADIRGKCFPPSFLFGVGSSAYQAEGAWNDSGKGQNIWDVISHKHQYLIKDGSNADISTNSFHKIDEDVQLLKDLGVDFYRFSLSWSRIVPNGRVEDGVNMKGVMYYQELLQKLHFAGIKAVVSLFHFDIPSNLFEERIFLDDGRLNDVFVDYARLAFSLFGNKVKYWLTFNEPHIYCVILLPVLYGSPVVDPYICGHNIIKAHALVYHLYDEEFRSEYEGEISISLDTIWPVPKTNTTGNIDASERLLLFEFGWYAHPLVFGDYPEVMKKRIREYTSSEKPSRLPEFTLQEKQYIKGTLDFIALNHYSSSIISDTPNDDSFTFYEDAGLSMSRYSCWENTAADIFQVTPFGMRKILRWIHGTYKLPIFITENGYADKGGLSDFKRINFLQVYLKNVFDAIFEDNVKVLGYSVWSFMDSWEWLSGYSLKFGLYYVNFTSPNRERIAKKSALYYKKLLKFRCLDSTLEF